MRNQSYSSWKTAIKRKCLSTPMRYLREMLLLKGRVLDYGCGRGDEFLFLKHEMNIEGYDPHFFPDKPVGTFDTITCNYVLNVVTPEEEKEILSTTDSLLCPGGRAYVSVRRDIPREGKQGRAGLQRFVHCPKGYRTIRVTPLFEMFCKTKEEVC